MEPLTKKAWEDEMIEMEWVCPNPNCEVVNSAAVEFCFKCGTRCPEDEFDDEPEADDGSMGEILDDDDKED